MDKEQLRDRLVYILRGLMSSGKPRRGDALTVRVSRIAAWTAPQVKSWRRINARIGRRRHRKKSFVNDAVAARLTCGQASALQLRHAGRRAQDHDLQQHADRRHLGSGLHTQKLRGVTCKGNDTGSSAWTPASILELGYARWPPRSSKHQRVEAPLRSASAPPLSERSIVSQQSRTCLDTRSGPAT